MSPKRIFIAGIAFACLWQVGKAAGDGLVTDASYRRSFAAAHATDTVQLTTAGFQDRTLIFETYPRTL